MWSLTRKKEKKGTLFHQIRGENKRKILHTVGWDTGHLAAIKCDKRHFCFLE